VIVKRKSIYIYSPGAGFLRHRNDDAQWGELYFAQRFKTHEEAIREIDERPLMSDLVILQELGEM
jgi:hypothetical protein